MQRLAVSTLGFPVRHSPAVRSAVSELKAFVKVADLTRPKAKATLQRLSKNARAQVVAALRDADDLDEIGGGY
jgi:hypothetical protein